MARGIFEGVSKKNLVVFLFGDVFSHSFFFKTCIHVRLVYRFVRWAILCSSTSQYPEETVILLDSEQGFCKPVVLPSDSESSVDESGLGLKSRYM